MVIVVFCVIKATGRKLLFSSYTTGLGFFNAKKAIFYLTSAVFVTVSV